MQKEATKDDEEQNTERDEAAKTVRAFGATISEALGFHFFGGEISLGSFGVVFAVVVFVIILPGGMVLLPFGIDGGLIDGDVFECTGVGTFSGGRCGGRIRIIIR